jgi:hypothetical protein
VLWFDVLCLDDMKHVVSHASHNELKASLHAISSKSWQHPLKDGFVSGVAAIACFNKSNSSGVIFGVKSSLSPVKGTGSI